MNKKTIRIAGWALGLSMAVAGIGVIAAQTFNYSPVEVNAATSQKTGSWDLTSADSDFSGSYSTYFTQPYGLKSQNQYIVNSSISDFSTEGTTSIRVGIKCLQNNSTANRLTVWLVNSSGETLGDGVVLTPPNATAASSTSYVYATFTNAAQLTGAYGFMAKLTSRSVNSLINGASYEVNYDATKYVVDKLLLNDSDSYSAMTIDGLNAVTSKSANLSYEVTYSGTSGNGKVLTTVVDDEDQETTNVEVSDDDSGTLTITARANGTYTLTVTTIDKNSSSVAVSKDVVITVQNLLTPAHPVKVTSTSDLSIGDVVYFVNEGANVAAGEISGTYLTAASVTISASEITNVGDAVGFVLGRNGSNYTFRSGSNYLGTSAAKSINLSSSGTTTWALSFEGSNAIVTSTNDSYGQIYYNASNPRFLNYTSSQTAIQMYVVSASDAEVAAEFENTYLVMGKNVPGQCNDLYANAKATYATLTNEQKSLISVDALNRLHDWASAKGDEFDPETRTFAARAVNAGIYDVQTNGSSMVLLVTIVLGTGFLGAGSFFLARRKNKE